MLEIEGLAHAYGRHTALADVRLRIGAGDVVAVLGANGAGKTTLLGAIAGLIRPTAGSVRFRGTELIGAPVHRIVELGIATVTEERHLFGPMTVQENLRLGAFSPHARGRTEANLARVLDLFPRLKERFAQRVHTMSGGERQMVSIGRALMAEPVLLLLDEPSLGLAPRVAAELFGALERIAAEGGMSILMVEQNARRALKMAQRAYLLSLGRIVGEGDAASLAQDPAVAKSYLGL